MISRHFAASIAIVAATLVADAHAQDQSSVSVREDGGTYLVEARFSVPESSDIARAVLTDYANIPRFMPDVRMSDVVERQDGYARVEQEAVSKFLMFSKRVHLVLDIDEGAGVIRFRDRCKKSFVHYEGSWTFDEQDGDTEIAYQLRAQPAFSVPQFVLRKLLNRNARVMIEQLRAEIDSRATAIQTAR